MNAEELKSILEKHELWLNSKESGERADLEGADLEGADLREADFRRADLEGAYQVVGAGSENRCTTYFPANDMVVCGCWNDNKGNTLESFKKRVEDIYGEYGKNPNPLYYQEYKAAIAFFEAVRNLREDK